MAVNRKELIICLQDLIQTCRDSEQGFQAASESIQDEAMKSFFRQCSAQRAQFATELQAEVRRLGGDPGDRGTVGGLIHRGIMHFKSAAKRKNDGVIVAECERGEHAAVSNYQRVLKQNLPPRVMPIVKRQFVSIKQVHDQLRGREQAA